MSRITRIAAVLVSLFICVDVHAQSQPQAPVQSKKIISGDMAGVIEAGEYLVTSTLTVPEGDTLNILAGAVLYFDQYTGIDVRGSLSVLGDPVNLVVLTSVNDTAGSSEPAQAFDWNGIKSDGRAAVLAIRYARVANSVYGVNVTDPNGRAEFESVVFSNNGYASLVRGDDIVATIPGERFSDRWNMGPPPELSRPSLANGVGVPVDPGADSGKGGRGRLVLRAGSIGVAAVGVIMTGVGIVRLDGGFRRYVDDPSDGNKADVWSGVTLSSVGVALTGGALTCIGITLFF